MSYLDILQRYNNFMFNHFGARNHVMEMQWFINSKRNAKNTPDKDDILDNGFSQ